MPERPPSQTNLGDFAHDPADDPPADVDNTSNSDQDYTERVSSIRERGERELANPDGRQA